MNKRWRTALAAALLALAWGSAPAAPEGGQGAGASAPVGSAGASKGSKQPPVLSPAAGLHACRLAGHEHAAACGHLSRPLNPAEPAGARIDVHFAVLPALARNKQPDPVFVFAGGPGQSAIELAGSWSRLLARVSNRRDIVLVDQRGTGRSARLACPEVPPATPLAQVLPEAAQMARLQACRAALQRLPHGDLRQYTTAIAMQDVEAVRQALGAPRINLVGGSYGTRAALEYQRQFPQAVRRLVIDGVAPPDMVLMSAFSTDNQGALDAMFAACERDASGCARRHPALRARWRQLLGTLPKEVTVAHPVTGVAERLSLTRESVLGWVRAPLYSPTLAAALPMALDEATRGRFEPLLGLASGVGGSRAAMLAEGMHFSVVCAEDLARLEAAGSGDAANVPGADFGRDFAERYRQVCAGWPRGAVPAAFYDIPAAPAPALVLSGGADPATPPRHGERVVRQLGAKARHVVVAEAGHGVMGLPCMRDVLFRFIGAETEAEALAVKADCAAAVPRPPAFVPPGNASAAMASKAAAASTSASAAASTATSAAAFAATANAKTGRP
jgi:pimeloyl-ACP methyl ester carboxylesterase